MYLNGFTTVFQLRTSLTNLASITLTPMVCKSASRGEPLPPEAAEMVRAPLPPPPLPLQT